MQSEVGLRIRIFLFWYSGAIRDQRLIPWDEDIDLWIPKSECPKVEKLKQVFLENSMIMRNRTEASMTSSETSSKELKLGNFKHMTNFCFKLTLLKCATKRSLFGFPQVVLKNGKEMNRARISGLGGLSMMCARIYKLPDEWHADIWDFEELTREEALKKGTKITSLSLDY